MGLMRRHHLIRRYNMGRRGISQLCLWAVTICLYQHVQNVSADTITITKVTCQHAATGIDNWAIEMASALGGLLAATNNTHVGGFDLMNCPKTRAASTLVSSTLGTASGSLPGTASDVASAAKCGADKGAALLNWINSVTSGTDNLVINVNGHQVFPVGGGNYKITAGQTIEPKVQFDFSGGARVQLIEFDSGSDNDDLGYIEINGDVKPGETYTVEDALVSNKAEGDLYKVSYTVERNDKGKEAVYLQCGTAACRECVNDPCCKTTTNKGQDRDGDKGDLKSCPPSFTDKGWKTYDIMWAEDVMLRICGNQHTNSDSCDIKIPRTAAAAEEEKAGIKLREILANRFNRMESHGERQLPIADPLKRQLPPANPLKQRLRTELKRRLMRLLEEE